MSRVFFDTNIFIYLFEDRAPWSDEVFRLLDRMRVRGDSLITSTLTMGELLVKPTESKDFALAANYEESLKASGCQVIPFDLEAARKFAEVRQDRTIKGPDAIQLACAARAKCDLFVTNDERLSRKNIDGLQFIVSLSRVPI